MTTEQLPRIDAAQPARRRRFGVRSIIRRVLKPLAMVAVAGTLAITLTVTTTQKAEANPLLLPPVIFTGATMLTAGEALTAAAFIPVIGWTVLGVGLVAAAAYTSPTWMPYLTGAFGQPADQNRTPQDNQSAQTGRHNVLDYTRSADKLTFTVRYNDTFQTGSQGWNMHYGMIAHCLNSSTGASGYKSSNGYYVINPNTAPGIYGPSMTPCPIGYTPTGWLIGGGGGQTRGAFTPNLDTTQGGNPATFNTLNTQFDFGATNQILGGDMSPNQGFDPASPDVKYKTTVECIRADGTKFSVSAEAAGDQKAIQVPSCAATDPGSHGTGKVDVVGFAPGSTVPTTLGGSPAVGTVSDYPLCSPAKAGPMCMLSVQVDGKPCVVGDWACAHWPDIKAQDATRVRCDYGPYVGIPVNNCNPLERAYELGGSPATTANTDGNPATRSDTDPNGQQIPKNSTGTGTGTGTIPGTGGQNSPNASPSEQACFPSGWAALNPVEWVLKPVGCALTAAFVPKPEVVTQQTTRLDTKIKNVGFARISTAWLSTFQAAGGGSGCTGPTVNFDMEGVHQSFQPFNACSQPMAGVAATTNAISAVFIVLFGGLGIMRALGAAFGFNFSMGRGGDGD